MLAKSGGQRFANCALASISIHQLKRTYRNSWSLLYLDQAFHSLKLQVDRKISAECQADLLSIFLFWGCMWSFSEENMNCWWRLYLLNHAWRQSLLCSEAIWLYSCSTPDQTWVPSSSWWTLTMQYHFHQTWDVKTWILWFSEFLPFVFFPLKGSFFFLVTSFWQHLV